MEVKELKQVIEKQRDYFRSGKTLNTGERLKILSKLRDLIIQYEPELKKALWSDFHKPAFEVMATETGFVLNELNLTIRNLRRWSRPKKVWTPLVHFMASSFISYQPYGNVLILSPWNFPFQLAMVPLVGAIAAGNTAILKLSQQVPATGKVMREMLSSFPDEIIFTAEGDHSISEFLLDQKFDYIFFTGSTRIGRHVLEKASVNLTPVSLELGGKNPCVVTRDARLDYAAKRIMWGKFINGGQTCVCPDYLIIDREIKDKFLELATRTLREFYGDEPEKSDHFARVINGSNVTRLNGFAGTGECITGGKGDPGKCYMPPTIIDNVSPDDPVMQDEIFGPVLPVVSYDRFDEVFEIIRRHPSPLAVYIFSKNKKIIREFLDRTSSGTAGVNDTVMQYANPYLPFGGIGSSGHGRYHGRKSFETFSNIRSVLVKSNLVDIFLRYPPYTSLKEKIVSMLMR